MNAIEKISQTDRYARCVQTSKRVRWDIDKDVIRGRRFDAAHKFLPDGLSLVEAFTTLSADEKRFVSQIQGRTYANIFGLVERFINAKVLELSHDHWFGDQVALEALVRFSEARAIEAAFLKAYRWQYIHSGAKHPHFGKVLSGFITEQQGQRIQTALATLH